MSTISQSVDKKEIKAFILKLQQTIISKFETYEEKGHQFEQGDWDYSQGSGGGHKAILRGLCFEKAAVHTSYISGDSFPMKDGHGSFSALGISLITHMTNPFCPTVHMNIRYIETEKEAWFGGGYDLTPMGYPFKEDTDHFHTVARETLNQSDLSLYPKFSENAKEYFYIPHRNKERGVGGIFFDHYWTGNIEADINMWKNVGNTFLETICPIYDRRNDFPYTVKDKAQQNAQRAHYAEFNLLYDRGTRFGLASGGNPETILSSLPPTATWQ